MLSTHVADDAHKEQKVVPQHLHRYLSPVSLLQPFQGDEPKVLAPTVLRAVAPPA